jgi:hypothetical protein
MRDWLFALWLEMRETYIRRLLDMLAATRQNNQWILQENQRTWPKIIDEVVRAMLTMQDRALAILRELSSGIASVLSGIAASAAASGAALGNAFADGIRASIPAIEDAARAAADAARRYLPGSDAETGPLSDLTASGRALPETLAKGMRGGISEIVNAANVLATAMRPPYVTKPFEAESVLGKMKPKIKPPKPATTRPWEPAQPVLNTRPLEQVMSQITAVFSQLAKPISAIKPQPPAYATRPAIPALTPAYATRPAVPDPTPKPAPTIGGMGQGKPGQCITINIYNPTGSPSEASIMHALKQLAAVGVLSPVTVN